MASKHDTAVPIGRKIRDMKHQEEKYELFLSYRRDGGMDTATLLRQTLTSKGYRVFIDVESLRSGAFNKKLYEIIDNWTGSGWKSNEPNKAGRISSRLC